MNVDNRLMLNATMRLAPDASAQLKQPEIAQNFLAAHQIKEQQQKSEGRIAEVEKQEKSNTLQNDKEGGGAFYESAGEFEGGEEEQWADLGAEEQLSAPSVELGRKVRSKAPNNPFRFDVSI